MDHPCHKCGNSVEDGKAFCSQCGAPQIRVAVPEPSAQTVAGSVSSSEPSVFPLDSPIVSGTLNPPALSTSIHWPRAFRACAIAALISAFVMALRMTVPLLAGLGAGVLAVILYHRRNPAWSVNARSGAQVGALSGLLFFGISAVLKSLEVAVFHGGVQVRQTILEALQQAASRSTDPEVQAALDRFKTPEGMAAMIILFLVVLFLFSVFVSSLAGAMTGAFLGRRNRP
jgi:hypothetical protein